MVVAVSVGRSGQCSAVCGTRAYGLVLGTAPSSTHGVLHGTSRVLTPALVGCASDGRMVTGGRSRSCHEASRSVLWGDSSRRGTFQHSQRTHTGPSFLPLRVLHAAVKHSRPCSARTAAAVRSSYRMHVVSTRLRVRRRRHQPAHACADDFRRCAPRAIDAAEPSNGRRPCAVVLTVPYRRGTPQSYVAVGCGGTAALAVLCWRGSSARIGGVLTGTRGC